MKTGISLYPDLMTKEEIISRLEEAKDFGVDIVFTSIQLENLNFAGLNNDWTNFELFFSKCKELNFEVSVDLNNETINKLGVKNIDDLSSINKLGISTIRIDGGFNSSELVELTNNKDNIKIEINASMTHNIEELLLKIKNEGNLKNLLACHNFFPREFTGLGWNRFDKYNEIIRKYNIEIGAFITTSNSKSKLCSTSKEVPTIELHRGVSLKYQMQDFKARDIDYVLLSEDTYTREDLKTMAEEAKNENVVIYINNLDERITLPTTSLSIRADRPEHVVRIDERIGDIKEFNNNIVIEKYSVTIDNIRNGRYSGEIQFALTNMPARKYINVIGTVGKEQHNLISSEYIINKKIKLVSI